MQRLLASNTRWKVGRERKATAGAASDPEITESRRFGPGMVVGEREPVLVVCPFHSMFEPVSVKNDQRWLGSSRYDTVNALCAIYTTLGHSPEQPTSDTL